MLYSGAYVVLALFILGSDARDFTDPHTLTEDMPIVHLFEWKWSDVALECERFLSAKGYGGVQVSPVSENAVVMSANEQRPWWERYQPVSYSLDTTRSGTRSEFIDMVNRCNNVNVNIYVDIIVNHMTGNSGGVGTGSCGYDYGAGSYPCVPYSSPDFNSDCSINDYNDAENVRNCRLVGLIDLNQSKEYVRGKIVDFMNDLIDIGVAGFRMDACKHMWPGDLYEIYNRLNTLNTIWFFDNSDPFIYQEVIDVGNEAIEATEYTGLGAVTEFLWSMNIGEVFRGVNGQKLSYLENFGEEWGMLDSSVSLVFTDNHDNQRGHGAGGANIITFRDSKLYKMATGYMLAWPYGTARVMSSYVWTPYDDNWVGPPHDGDYSITSPVILSDDSCESDYVYGWNCEHRWRQIYNMVGFRNVVRGTIKENWWENFSDGNQIAFSRGNKGFVALNTENYELAENIYTGLPAGTYCDIISGNANETPNCSGATVDVDDNGYGFIYVPSLDSPEDGILAIHV